MDLSQLDFADLSIKTQNKAFSIKSPNFLWEVSEEVTFSIFQPQLINNDDDHDVGVLICNSILIHF